MAACETRVSSRDRWTVQVLPPAQETPVRTGEHSRLSKGTKKLLHVSISEDIPGTRC